MPEQTLDIQQARHAVLRGTNLMQHHMQVAGVETAVLVGGDGPPMVLLHGPGESSLWFIRVVDDLARNFRVIVPDMPGHGASAPVARLDEEAAVAWLAALMERTCAEPLVLVGHVTGGTVAAKLALQRPEQVRQLVLVDALGLAPFAPQPEFGQGLRGFLAQPTRDTAHPFFDQCFLDSSGVVRAMGDKWSPFLEYYLSCLHGAAGKAMGELMEAVGYAPMDATELRALNVPTALVWGRHDQATSVRVAEAASKEYGWSLRVIEGSGDDPKLEKPAEFVKAIRALVG